MLGNLRINIISAYRSIDKRFYPLKIFILSRTEPACYLIDKNAKTILDVGCGKGMPMKLIKMRLRNIKTTGVDLYTPYIEQARKEKIHDKYIAKDIRNLSFPRGSFDVVLALQVLEHLSKKDAWLVLENLEKIAKKQVIVATPIGEMQHPLYDDNLLQIHKCSFQPEEFEKKGYNVLRWGRKEILDDCDGIVYKIKNDMLRKIIYLLFLFFSPLFIAFPKFANFYLYAYKQIDNK